MKILIVSYHFFPAITPRAFRSFELAKELSKLDNNVTIVIPKCNFDYKDLELEYNFRIIEVDSGFFIAKNYKKKLSLSSNNFKKEFNKESIARKFFKKIFHAIYMNGYLFEFFWPVYKYLSADKNKYDLAISIGLPISAHLGLALARKANKQLADVFVADYGDPFSYNQNGKANILHRNIEKMILNQFNFISLPVEDAKKAFEKFKVSDKIKIIPQGFDFYNVKISEYKKHKIPHFAYAGMFYENTRNPAVLFDYLCTIEEDFCFVLFTPINDRVNMACIEPYINKLGVKLVVNKLVPREECIFELSKFDFLINQNNLSMIQSPSKLIDYALTQRPIFHFAQNDFNEEDFKLMFNGIFRQKHQRNIIDVDRYNIINVAKEFLKLHDRVVEY